MDNVHAGRNHPEVFSKVKNMGAFMPGYVMLVLALLLSVILMILMLVMPMATEIHKWVQFAVLLLLSIGTMITSMSLKKLH
jgi:protein-S-isoprenylcysteine O-methyltransferase Ste14